MCTVSQLIRNSVLARIVLVFIKKSSPHEMHILANAVYSFFIILVFKSTSISKFFPVLLFSGSILISTAMKLLYIQFLFFE